MNELVIREDQKVLSPLSMELFEKAVISIKRFQDISTFEDLKLWLFYGDGLADNTYNNYMQSVKEFYSLFEGLHPLQWTPGHIEKFYDYILKKNSIATASLKISGIKKICANIKIKMPFWNSPFEIMGDNLKKKLAAGEQSKKKISLYKKELQSVLQFLDNDSSIKGLQNKAMILTLVTTGLRAFELCNLKYDDMEHDPDTGITYLKGIGKGNKPFHVEVHPDAVTACYDAFTARFGRPWTTGDYLFWSLENYHGKPPVRMSKPVLWVRLRDIGNELKEQGLIRKEIEFAAHLFRRTFLTLLSREGMQTVEIQRHSRHANLEVLVNHYIDLKESTRSYLDNILGVA